MSFEKTKKYLSSLGLESRIREFDQSSATVELSPAELEKYSGSLEWIDVCSGWTK